jgi:DNA phosphorothioation-dependent restriction protein DptG
MTPARQEILRVLEALSQLYPDMRFGQLVVNISNWATHTPDAVWDVEDDTFLAAAQSHLERRTRKQEGQTAPSAR